MAELMSEGLADPVVMIRRGNHKFIGGPDHPSQVFDLERDPDELNDLAGAPESQDLVRSFTDTMNAVWDFDVLKRDILKSQKRRAVIHQAHQQGTAPVWDISPEDGEASRWLRGSGDYGDWAFKELPYKPA